MDFSKLLATNFSVACLMVVTMVLNWAVARTVRYSIFGEAAEIAGT